MNQGNIILKNEAGDAGDNDEKKMLRKYVPSVLLFLLFEAVAVAL